MNRMIKKISLMTLAAMASLSLLAQKVEVKGKVMEADNKQPLIGVTVIEKESNRGTVTDMNGEFSIMTERGKRLQFTYVGYKTKEVKVKSDWIEVYLKPDKAPLEEMMMVAFGSQKVRGWTRRLPRGEGSDTRFRLSTPSSGKR